MGGSNSTQVSQTGAYVSSVMMSSAVSSNTTCSQSSALVENQVVTVDNTENDKVLELCLTLANGNAAANKSCQSFIQTATVNDISQGASIVLSTNCTVNTAMLATMQQDVTNAIMNKITSSTDDIGEFLKSVAVAAGGNVNNTTSMSTTVSNMVSSTMTLTATQSMITTLSQAQNQQLNLKNFTGTYKAMNQLLQVQALATLVASNTATNTAVQKAENSVTNDVTASSDLTNVFDGLWKTLQTGLGVLGNWIYAIYAVIGLIVICCCFVCVVPLFTSGSKPSTVASSIAGSAMSSEGAATGSALSKYIPTENQAATLLKLFAK